jgi:hypothetical protein
MFIFTKYFTRVLFPLVTLTGMIIVFYFYFLFLFLLIFSFFIFFLVLLLTWYKSYKQLKRIIYTLNHSSNTICNKRKRNCRVQYWIWKYWFDSGKLVCRLSLSPYRVWRYEYGRFFFYNGKKSKVCMQYYLAYLFSKLFCYI